MITPCIGWWAGPAAESLSWAGSRSSLSITKQILGRSGKRPAVSIIIGASKVFLHFWKAGTKGEILYIIKPSQYQQGRHKHARCVTAMIHFFTKSCSFFISSREGTSIIWFQVPLGMVFQSCARTWGGWELVARKTLLLQVQ